MRPTTVAVTVRAISVWMSKTSRTSRSNRSAQTSSPLAQRIRCAATRSRSPAARTDPLSM